MQHAINAAVSVISVIKQFRNLEYIFLSFFDALVMALSKQGTDQFFLF